MQFDNSVIKTLREKKKLTIDDLARELRCTKQAVSCWEIGSTLPSIHNLVRLATFFKVPINIFFPKVSSNKVDTNKAA